MLKGFTVCVVAVLLLAGMPLAAVVIVTAVLGPAAEAQLRAVTCGPIPATGAWRPPLDGAYTMSDRGFGPRLHPIDEHVRQHDGQDMTARPGPGQVVAAAAGTVVSAGPRGGYGLMVQLQHPDQLPGQHEGEISTRYAHLASIDAAVSPGAVVAAGQALGVEGSTGASTGRHLHFEVRVDAIAVDPVLFMAERGAPLDGRPLGTVAIPAADTGIGTGPVEGGVGFALPPAGALRRASLTTPPQPIPSDMKALYEAAAAQYQLPWTLLAGIGMAETNHGRVDAISSAGARGPMQFMSATWAAMGVDGDGDGRADITNDADSVFSAANYLTRSGVVEGPEGVRGALFAYNRADWYVNDVLTYAHAYGGGTVLGDPTRCVPGQGDPSLPPLTDQRSATVLAWAAAQAGEPYVFGANGPDAWDCSSFTRAAYAQIGISMPRTAAAQRDWLAAGNGYRVQAGQERPGDLIFWNSYLGPGRVGHVVIVWDPATRTTVEAQGTATGVGHFSYADNLDRPLVEIWRVGNVTDRA